MVSISSGGPSDWLVPKSSKPALLHGATACRTRAAGVPRFDFTCATGRAFTEVRFIPVRDGSWVARIIAITDGNIH